VKIVVERKTLLTPLPVQQRTAFLVVLANLYEQEGLVGLKVAQQWWRAADHLLAQLGDVEPIIVVPSIQYVTCWIAKAEEAMKNARSKDSKTRKELDEWVRQVKLTTVLQAAQMMVRIAFY